MEETASSAETILPPTNKGDIEAGDVVNELGNINHDISQDSVGFRA